MPYLAIFNLLDARVRVEISEEDLINILFS
jgi:hypothetical protein